MKKSPDPTHEHTAHTKETILTAHRLFTHRSFLSHLYDTVRSATLYAHWQRWLTYFRRFRLIALLLRVATWLLMVLETGALVLLSSAILLIFLPILIFLMLAVLLTTLFDAPRKNRIIDTMSIGRRVYVLFLPDGEGHFFAANARDLAARENSLVVIVSPRWLSSRGIRSGAFYCTARQEEAGIILVRRYYYFSLKRHVLVHRETAYLY